MNFEIELRESKRNRQTLYGVMLQEGRAATGGRAELFAPGSVEWPSSGVGIATVHLGPTETRGQVIRHSDGRLSLTAPSTPEVAKAFNEGKRFLSVEFVAQKARVTAGGVREILSALVHRAAMVKTPEYDMTAVEVRGAVVEIERKARLWL